MMAIDVTVAGRAMTALDADFLARIEAAEGYMAPQELSRKFRCAHRMTLADYDALYDQLKAARLFGAGVATMVLTPRGLAMLRSYEGAGAGAVSDS